MTLDDRVDTLHLLARLAFFGLDYEPTHTPDGEPLLLCPLPDDRCEDGYVAFVGRKLSS